MSDCNLNTQSCFIIDFFIVHNSINLKFHYKVEIPTYPNGILRISKWSIPLFPWGLTWNQLCKLIRRENRVENNNQREIINFGLFMFYNYFKLNIKTKKFKICECRIDFKGINYLDFWFSWHPCFVLCSKVDSFLNNNNKTHENFKWVTLFLSKFFTKEGMFI